MSRSGKNEGRGRKKNTGQGLLALVKKEQSLSNKMLVYKGPIMVPGSKENVQEFQTNLFSLVGMTTTGGGLLNSVFPIAPSSFSNYLALFANFDEWRLLGLEVQYVPHSRNALLPLTTSTQDLMAVCSWAIDRDSAAAYTGYTGTGATFSTNNSSCKLFAPNERSTLTYRMNGADAAAWNTPTSANQLWIKTYASGLSNTTTYGYFYFKALFQFRGRT